MFRRRTATGQLTGWGKTIRSLGLGRLLYQLYHRPLAFVRRQFLPARPVTIDLFGYRLTVPPPKANFCHAQIYAARLWEPEVTSAVKHLVKPGMNVVDVGADIGYYVLLFASLNGNGFIWAFEPFLPNLSLLSETVRKNNLSKVRLFPFGLGDREESISPIAANPTKSGQIMAPSEPPTTMDIKVFDDLLPTIEPRPSRIDFVLIDVEGAEMNVLLGMKRTIQCDRPLLLIELHGPLLPEFGYTKAGLVDWLMRQRYRAQWLAGEAIEDEGFTHALFVPDESSIDPAYLGNPAR